MCVWVLLFHWKPIRKCVFFAKEIAFSKRIISQFSRLRRATLPAIFNLYSTPVPPTQAFVKCTGGHRALYTCMHKTIFTLWLAWYAQWIISNLRAATALSTRAQNASYNTVIGTRQKVYHICFTGALFTSQHACKKYLGRKVAAGPKKLKYKS